MALSFANAVGEWAKQTERRLEAVFKASAQALADEVNTTVNEGGRLPIKTGNLRRSLMGSTSAPPAVKDAKFEGEPSYETAVLGAKLGDTIHFGFQAAYAKRLEYGFVGEDSLGRSYNQAGSGFVKAAVLRWPQIVAEQTAIIRGRVEARAR